jgi:glycosyltransferase involved in cell wall biosynthesis
MSAISKPLVSILINNYNYADFVSAAVDSAVSQTYAPIEIIVVDDGSKDRSLEMLAGFGDRIRVLSKPNGGQASAINAGFSVSQGEIICLLDADDLFVPEKVARVVQILTDNANLGWCFDTVYEFHSDDVSHRLNEYRYQARDVPFGRWDVRDRTLAGKPPYIPTATSGLSFRRTLLSQVLPMPEAIRITSDNYIKLLALASSAGWFTAEKLTLQRIHSQNAVTNRLSGRRKTASRIEVMTGIALCEKSRRYETLGKGLVSYGLATLLLSGGFDPALKRQLRAFLRNLGMAATCCVLARTAYWGVRRVGL